MRFCLECNYRKSNGPNNDVFHRLLSNFILLLSETTTQSSFGMCHKLDCVLRIDRRFTSIYLFSSSHFFVFFFLFWCFVGEKYNLKFHTKLFLLQLQDFYDSRTNLLTPNGSIFNHETDVEIQPGISFYVSGTILNNCEGYALIIFLFCIFFSLGKK